MSADGTRSRGRGRTFSFEGEWIVERSRPILRDVLVDLEHYPDWWPQVRAVASLGPDDARVLVRSALPYTLDLVLHAEQRGEALLETSIDGDLVGWVRWRLADHGAGTRLRLEQEVQVSGRLLALASYAVRPVLVWNHERMMAAAVAALRST